MERKKRKLLGSEVKWYAFLNFRRDYNYTESCKRSERANGERERNKAAVETFAHRKTSDGEEDDDKIEICTR